ncbi:helix-turn-helix transcriptional regulator [Novosphingobium album (ex Hu et al. 2023)]|uniref:Helix-turn-helix transcriptional regulator n=1 Tax=Novosphingobium album (ex Hu et al. 2023) TaxID=2930093 RepID=A0ABT0B0Z4_9SPHN|nr:helix-turn-helix transcriptional regulator [Novosphingobium album (ex Hu et al. 2023)]MCJ2178591.1 helix-turn-helix transcriptional regulator [Novosphingobium album (ex Hu et al. 2023)]
MELVIRCTGVHIEVQVQPKLDLGQLADFLMPLAALTLYKVTEAIIADRVSSTQLELTLSGSQLSAELWSGVNCAVSAEADVNRLLIPLQLATLENPEHDPALWVQVQESFRHLSSTRHAMSFSTRIREQIVHSILKDGKAPRLKKIAATEGVSPRTIIRSLANEGTTFFDLVEQERRNLAAELINNPALSLDNVAVKLGFGDRSSFGRSFRKWFGMAPGKFRRNIVQKAATLTNSVAALSFNMPLSDLLRNVV